MLWLFSAVLETSDAMMPQQKKHGAAQVHTPTHPESMVLCSLIKAFVHNMTRDTTLQN